MTPVHEYLTEGILPEEKKKARALRRKAVSMHFGPRSVVAKALRSGYYWPTMHTDARNLIRECIDCQVHRPVPRNPQEKLTPITSPWPFYKWGIDIAGPFSEGPGKTFWKKKESKHQSRKREAKPRWKNTITPGSEAQAFIRETSFTGITKQATWKTGASSDLSGKGHTKSRKHWAEKYTSLETAMEIPFREHGISASLRNAICMKCKHLLHARQSGREGTA
ncbi:reverse transcriptase domain-containing protein [Tanacetum coccineum]